MDTTGIRRGRKAGRSEPIITAFHTQVKGEPSIPFIGLAEGMVLAAMRQAGVPMQRIRPAIAELAHEIGIEHALASRNLYTDGAELLYDYSKTLRGEDARIIRDLVVVRSKQRVFADVIESYLKRIGYSRDGYAATIRLPGFERADVIADPDRSFGQPIFINGAATVRDVLERFWAGDDIRSLSEEFGVPEPEIEDVLRATSRQAA